MPHLKHTNSPSYAPSPAHQFLCRLHPTTAGHLPLPPPNTVCHIIIIYVWRIPRKVTDVVYFVACVRNYSAHSEVPRGTRQPWEGYCVQFNKDESLECGDRSWRIVVALHRIVSTHFELRLLYPWLANSAYSHLQCVNRRNGKDVAHVILVPFLSV